MNEKYTGPDGSPEPDMIPGCFYRSNQKEYFGKKKNDLKTVREKLDGNLGKFFFFKNNFLNFFKKFFSFFFQKRKW